MTNRKSTMGFPLSCRWSACVTPKWLIPQRVAQKAILVCFLKIKFNFNRIKSATKFLCVKTSSGKVVWPFPYQTVYRYSHEMWPFNLKCNLKLTHPLKMRSSCGLPVVAELPVVRYLLNLGLKLSCFNRQELYALRVLSSVDQKLHYNEQISMLTFKNFVEATPLNIFSSTPKPLTWPFTKDFSSISQF